MAALADSIPAKSHGLESPESLVLWNVIETHFDELEFAIEQLERRLDDPLRTLDDLARSSQSVVDAHTDGLVVGGDEVRERVLIPALLDASADQAPRAVAAALAVIAAGRFDLLWPAIKHEAVAVRQAVARAATLWAKPSLDAWVSDKLSRQQEPKALAGLLELCAARQLPPPNLLKALQSNDPELINAAARAARHGDSKQYLPVLESLVRHSDAQVRDTALLATLAWGSSLAWRALEVIARESSDGPQLALYAAVGGRRHHKVLRERFGKEPENPSLLFALGFSGNAEVVRELVPALRSKPRLLSNLAAQSISLIAGLDLEAKEFLVVRPSPDPSELPEEDAESRASLPALEDDDLEADLVPQPEDLIPELDLAAIERHCGQLQLDPARRLLGGVPFNAESLLGYFERAPLRRHHVLAQALAVMTAGTIWFDSRAAASQQRAQLATLRLRGLGSILRTYKDW